VTKYVAEATAARFHNDKTSKVKLLMSAVGQGKTVACIQEMLMVGIQQAPNADGVRRTRWAVIRSTFGQLKTTVIKTFQEWVPASLCQIVYDSPIRAHIKMYPLDDGTFLDIEFWFMPLDNPEALANLLGSELTGAYINELPEIKNANLVQDVFKRCGRYPPKKDGAPITWRGVIADYNPPPRKSWLHIATEIDPIPGWKLYRIPAPILVLRDEDDPDNMDKVHFVANPDAENVQHQPLGIDYWIDMAEQGKKTDWEGVRRFALGDYPNGVGGRAIFTLFSHSQHTVKSGLLPNRGSVLFVGLDLGLTPAAAFMQFVDGTVQQTDEITTRDSSITELIEDDLIPLLRTRYVGYKVIVVGDPTGGGRSQYDKTTPYRLFRKYGIKYVVPQGKNEFPIRRDATNKYLKRRNGYVIDEERCPDTVSAFLGNYQWDDSRAGASNQKPKKTGEEGWYSHIADAVMGVFVYFEQGAEVYSDTIEHHDNFSSWMMAGPESGTHKRSDEGYFYA
jgi:hypothetical protein